MTETQQRGVSRWMGWAGVASPEPALRRARRGPAAPVRGARPQRRSGHAPPELPGGRVHCRACGSPVTTEAYLLAVDGQEVHHRTNPAGVGFTFCCFAAAPGAEPVGEATTRHSWFAGQAWRLALCLACGAHLGWRFEGEGTAFFGLILDRLSTGRGAAGEGS